MMKYVFILAFIGVSLFASIQTSGIGFDYENATQEERSEWIANQASITRGAFVNAIKNRHGMNAAIKITSLVPSGTAALRGDVRLEYANAKGRKHAYRNELKTLFCPAYIKMPMADHDLRVIINMKDINDNQLTQFTLTNAECEKHMAKAEAKV